MEERLVKNLEEIKLIFSFDVHKNLSVSDIENCQRYEGYIETRAWLYKSQSAKTSVSQTLDHDSCEEATNRLHWQAYYWSKGLQSSIETLNIEENGREIKYTICANWITSPQIPLSWSRNKQVWGTNNSDWDEESATGLIRPLKKRIKRSCKHKNNNNIRNNKTEWKKESKKVQDMPQSVNKDYHWKCGHICAC